LISTLKLHPRPGILATMPVVTLAFMIRGDGLTALVSWALNRRVHHLVRRSARQARLMGGNALVTAWGL